MKIIASLFLYLYCITINAQGKILTQEEAKNFFDNAQLDEVMTLTFFENEEVNKEFYAFCASKSPGEIIITGNNAFKIKGIKEVEIQSCGMFHLNDSNLSPEKIEALHKMIIKKYKSGIPFTKLIEEYAADKSMGQEDFIFEISGMNEHYKHAFNLHVNDEIFGLYIPDVTNAIVLKNSPPEKIKAVIVEQAVFK